MCRTLFDVTWRSKRPSAPVSVSFKLSSPLLASRSGHLLARQVPFFGHSVPPAFEAAGVCVDAKVAAN